MKPRQADGRREAGRGRLLSTFHLRPFTKGSASFTLIEMIGVMALMAILAAVVVPPLFRTLEDAQRVDEDANQEAIAEALIRGIKAYRILPNPNVVATNRINGAPQGWVALASNFYPKGTESLRYVFPRATNKTETERRVYLDSVLVQYFANDPSFSMPSTGFNPTSDLNGNGIVDFDETLRMYIVSSSKQDLVLSCGKNQASPAPQGGADYGKSLIDDLLAWNKAFESSGANFGSLMVPGSIARWGKADGNNYRRGEYLHVKVVPLDKIFCKVQLIDCASPPTKKLTGGNGYAASASILALDGFGSSVYLFSNSGGAINAGQNKDGTWSVISAYNDRTSYPAPNKVTIPPGNADVEFTLPAVPKFQINNLAQNSVTPQRTEFYVLSGTQLKLLDSANTVLLTITIYDDSTFSYREGKWAPGD